MPDRDESAETNETGKADDNNGRDAGSLVIHLACILLDCVMRFRRLLSKMESDNRRRPDGKPPVVDLKANATRNN